MGRGRKLVWVVRTGGAVAVLALAGCGSNEQRVTIPSPNEASALPTESTPTQTETTPTAETTSSHPVVHFAAYEGAWPFTAQIASVTENPNGFPGGGVVPPQGQTVLMVQVNITSEVTGRTVPAPMLALHCSVPGVQFGNEGLYGFDGGEEAPDSSGSQIAFGDGQPHAWDDEWEVPEGTSTTEVSCELDVGTAGTKGYLALNLT
jgi:hypothetical protein